MNEANLERRLRELDSAKSSVAVPLIKLKPETDPQEQESQPDQLLELADNSLKSQKAAEIQMLTEQYEKLLQECEDDHTKTLEELAHSVNQTVLEANTKISGLTEQLHAAQEELVKNQEYCERLMQSVSFVSTVAIVLLNKWTTMLNIKNCFQQLTNSIKRIDKPISLHRKFRIAVHSAIVIHRLRSTVQLRIIKSKPAETHLPSSDNSPATWNQPSAEYTSRLIGRTAMYKEECGKFLICVDNMCRTQDSEAKRSDGQMPALILNLLASNRTQIHQSSQFTGNWPPRQPRICHPRLPTEQIQEENSPTFRLRGSDPSANIQIPDEVAEQLDEYRRRLCSAGDLLSSTLQMLKDRDNLVGELRRRLGEANHTVPFENLT